MGKPEIIQLFLIFFLFFKLQLPVVKDVCSTVDERLARYFYTSIYLKTLEIMFRNVMKTIDYNTTIGLHLKTLLRTKFLVCLYGEYQIKI